MRTLARAHDAFHAWQCARADDDHVRTRRVVVYVMIGLRARNSIEVCSISVCVCVYARMRVPSCVRAQRMPIRHVRKRTYQHCGSVAARLWGTHGKPICACFRPSVQHAVEQPNSNGTQTRTFFEMPPQYLKRRWISKTPLNKCDVSNAHLLGTHQQLFI